MKVIHVPYSYHPDPVGGTEIYVQSLAGGLRRAGIESVICAPAARSGSYSHEGVGVRRFAYDPGAFTVERGYEPDGMAAREFARILDAERPQVVHLHAMTHVVSSRVALEVKMRGMPLVFTYHDSKATCRTGTLQRGADVDCDGRLESSRCASCTLQGLGLHPLLSSAVASLPLPVGRLVARRGVHGKVWTAIRTRELVERQHAWARSFLGTTDAIVAQAPWVREILLVNGVPESKIVVCPQGLPEAVSTPEPPARPRSAGSLKVAMLSRLDDRKGIEVLIDAFAREPRLDMALDIYLVRQPGDERYARMVQDRAVADVRIRLIAAIPHSSVVDTLRSYHVLGVPSQCAETGPLVVLEAFAAGIPVLGSDVRGISDRVAHGRNGLLVPRRDVDAWAHALRRLATEPTLVARLSLGIEAPSTMTAVSERMATLYRDLLGRQAAHCPQARAEVA